MGVMTVGYAHPKGALIEDPYRGILHAAGVTVPTDATAGYAPGCLFIHSDGNDGDAVYVNDGTKDSCDFNAIPSGVTASGSELNALDITAAGTSEASKALVLDANQEMNDVGVIRSTDTLIATGAVLTLNATPVTLVAAPGATSYLEFVGAYVFLDYAGTAYAADAGEDLCIKYTDASGDVVSTSIDGEEFEATADALFIMSPVPTAPNIITHPANAPLVAHLLVGEWATGTSPLKIRTYYRVIRKASLEAIA